MSKLTISIAVNDDDHVRDRLSGAVQAEGIDLVPSVLPVEKVLRTSSVRQQLANAGGMEALISTPREFDELIHADHRKYGKLEGDLKLKIDRGRAAPHFS